MYASHGFLRSDIGDVDIVYHDGLYHLFHLILPNHDFIAHAVSEDGMNWRRVTNALFVSEPGNWDDDMLWTMHITPDPYQEGHWRMFYTGLSRSEYGRVQRVGLARSSDLYHWTRDNTASYPIQAQADHYESSISEGRHWVSFRDPFFYRDPDSGDHLLLTSARIKHGPLIRRGCVGVVREYEPNKFMSMKPLHHPGLYDDIEVPNLFRLNGRYFLLGSIREDTKVHYWYSDNLYGPYENFFDNVLLPRGNYAARICHDGNRLLLFNFFAKEEAVSGQRIVRKLLPPPKELDTDETGRLRLRSYYRFDDFVTEEHEVSKSNGMEQLFHNPLATYEHFDNALHLKCPSGYEAFLLPGDYEHMRLHARIGLLGSGKCGMVLRVDSEGNGYYLSLDLIKGLAQIRAWGENEGREHDRAFDYKQLQAGHFVNTGQGPWTIDVVVHGMYLEVSINGYVTLSLVDDTYHTGRCGFYAESATIRVEELFVDKLSPPKEAEEHGPLYTAAVSPDEDPPVGMPDTRK